MSKVNDLKQENEIKIRECLYDGQIWTKNDLAYKTSLSLATTTNILQEMLKSHEIEYVSDSKSTVGRKSKEYQLYKDYKHLLKIVLKKNKKSYEFIFEIIDSCVSYSIKVILEQTDKCFCILSFSDFNTPIFIFFISSRLL